MKKLTFRLANEQDLSLFDEIRNERLHKLHLSRIKKQAESKGEYFIVFRGKKPVGHIFINHNPQTYKYPVLEDLFVKEDLRKQGIANGILLFVEDHLREKGFDKVGLDVEVPKDWLKKLYERKGYKKVSGPHTWTCIIEDKGEKVTEEIYHLRKDL